MLKLSRDEEEYEYEEKNFSEINILNDHKYKYDIVLL